MAWGVVAAISYLLVPDKFRKANCQARYQSCSSAEVKSTPSAIYTVSFVAAGAPVPNGMIEGTHAEAESESRPERCEKSKKKIRRRRNACAGFRVCLSPQ
jgi:hypothetical protein